MVNYFGIQIVFKSMQMPLNLCKFYQVFRIAIKILQMLVEL
jgi:hypothetical protein